MFWLFNAGLVDISSPTSQRRAQLGSMQVAEREIVFIEMWCVMDATNLSRAMKSMWQRTAKRGRACSIPRTGRQCARDGEGYPPKLESLWNDPSTRTATPYGTGAAVCTADGSIGVARVLRPCSS